MSVSSPGIGAETSKAAARAFDDGTAGDEPTLEVELQHARWRHFAWAVVCCALGGFLIWRLGPVGKAIGAFTLFVGLMAGRAFVRTLVHPAGTISLGDEALQLTPEPCAGTRVRVALDDVRHAYFLRRALPWTTSGPVLVLETSRGVYTYPRDWFATDSDQRRLASALNRRLGRL